MQAQVAWRAIGNEPLKSHLVNPFAPRPPKLPAEANRSEFSHMMDACFGKPSETEWYSE
jgi:hypothetical protein